MYVTLEGENYNKIMSLTLSAPLLFYPPPTNDQMAPSVLDPNASIRI